MTLLQFARRQVLEKVLYSMQLMTFRLRVLNVLPRPLKDLRSVLRLSCPSSRREAELLRMLTAPLMRLLPVVIRLEFPRKNFMVLLVQVFMIAMLFASEVSVFTMMLYARLRVREVPEMSMNLIRSLSLLVMV